MLGVLRELLVHPFFVLAFVLISVALGALIAPELIPIAWVTYLFGLVGLPDSEVFERETE